MITEKKHEERLKKLGINIKTKYKSFDKVLERNTDNSKNDNILEGIIINKDYLIYKGDGKIYEAGRANANNSLSAGKRNKRQLDSCACA